MFLCIPSFSIYSINKCVILGDGAVQAFERFINWTKISIKISNETWYESQKLLEFRRKLRNSSDKFRDLVKSDFVYRASKHVAFKGDYDGFVY